jgi:hypothetical protein
LLVGGLRLWVHGRQTPGAHDADEGNRLDATIECDFPAGPWTGDVTLMASDLAGWVMESRVLMHQPSAPARLGVREQSVGIVLEAVGSPTRIRMQVTTAPGAGTPTQTVAFDLEESDLAQTIRQVDTILRAYPVRGTTLRRAA